jgi:predicted KAP-like P-loop ATPase
VKEQFDKYAFSADRPIQTATQDRLHRTRFSQSLANAISSWQGKDSLVIALNGEWGSGKSSVKNLAIEHLRSSTSNRLTILEFNPWQVAGQKQITTAFFDDISSTLGRIDTSKKAKKLAIKCSAYGRYLTTGTFLANRTTNFLASALWIIFALGLAGYFFWTHIFLFIMTVFSFFIAVTLSFSSKLLDTIAAVFRTESEANKLTLSETKAELSSLLKEIHNPLLVIIDDIDRLSTEELKQMFQLIKANADFPNLIYLLLFDREHVENGLKDFGGATYMEKIVQVGFEMPKFGRAQTNDLFGAGLTEILAAHNQLEAFNSDIGRWRDIYSSGLAWYLRNPRDIKRFLSAFAFQLGNFSENMPPEINCIDLAALQAIAVFEPQLYKSLFSARHFLTGEWDPQKGSAGSEKGLHERQKLFLDDLLSCVTEKQRGTALSILELLFPVLHQMRYKFYGRKEIQPEDVKNLRVCVPGYFDRYFLLTIPPNDLPEADLHLLIASAADREFFAGELITLSKNGLFDIVFERLEAHIDDLRRGNGQATLTVLFDIGEKLSNIETSYFINLPESRVASLALAILDKEPDLEHFLSSLRTSINAATGIYVPLLLFTKLFHERPLSSGLTNAHREEIQSLCVRKIEDFARDGGLSSHKRLIHILHYWHGMASSDFEARQWVSKLIELPEGLITFLRGMTTDVYSTSGTEQKTNILAISKFIDNSNLKSQIEKVLLAEISSRDQALLEAWRKALSQATTEGDVMFKDSD